MTWSSFYEKPISQETQITVITGSFNTVNNSDFTLLSRLEQQRALTIVNNVRRLQFVTSRAFLRRAIGSVLDSVPYTGDFIIDKFGKPHLPISYSTLCFNLSHTKQQLAVAFTRGIAVGIDIETRNRAVSQQLLKYAFNSQEIERIWASDNWQLTVLRGWTRKEAVLKCIGCGLSRDPKSIWVSLDDDNDPPLLAKELSIDEAISYRLLPLAHLQNTIGVVAVRDSPSACTLVQRELHKNTRQVA